MAIKFSYTVEKRVNVGKEPKGPIIYSIVKT